VPTARYRAVSKDTWCDLRPAQPGGCTGDV